MIRKNILTFFILLAVLRSQYIPNNLFIYNKNEILFDSGKNWINNTIFGSLSFQQFLFEFAGGARGARRVEEEEDYDYD